MKKSIIFVFFFSLWFVYPLMAQPVNLKLGTSAKVMTLFIHTEDEPPAKLHRFFGQYMQPYRHLSLQEPQAFRQAILAIANNIDAHTLLTVYYRGRAMADGRSNVLLTQSQTQRGLPAANQRIALNRDVLQPLLQKNPLGIFVFYDAQANPSGLPAFVNNAIDNAVVFYPTTSGDFIDLTQHKDDLSLPIRDWQFVKNASNSVENSLNYQRANSYCLYPRRQGCDTPAQQQPTPIASNATAQQQMPSCPIVHDYRLLPMAVIDLSLRAGCLKNQSFTVTLHGYVYGGQFDNSGKATLTLFPTKADGTVQINTHQGNVSFPVATPQIEQIERIILSWYGAPQLDLHVLPPRTTVNSNGDIWRGSACTPSVALQDRRFDCLKAADNTAMNMQVYSHALMPKQRGKKRRLTTFRVDYASRGSQPQLPYCGNGQWANIDYHIQQISRARRPRGMSFASASCEQSLSDKVRYFEINEKIRTFE